MKTPWPTEGLSVAWVDVVGQVEPWGALADCDPASAPADLALQGFMSALSEEHYCAGWLTGLEYALWDLAREGGGGFGMGDVTAAEAALLLALAEEAGAWWRWEGEGADSGPRRVALAEWKAHADAVREGREHVRGWF